MKLQESGEMYLETILLLSRRLNSVHSIDIAEEMNFSKPSVSRAINLLKDNGYLLMAKDGELTLTESGRNVAEKIYERHTVLSQVLERLGVPADIAAEDACRIEHAISDVSFEAVKKHIRQHTPAEEA